MMEKEWNLQTPLLLAFMALGTVTGQGLPPNYILTAYPPSPVDEENMTLSCTDRNGGDILTTEWFKSGDEIFQTSSDRRTSIITTVASNTTIYSDVEGRISVSTSTKQHNMTLMFKASIDNGTVWRCQSGQTESNNITIGITDHKDTSTEPSTSSTGLSIENLVSSSINNPGASPPSNGEDESPGFFENTNNIYIIAGGGGGAVLVILVIVIVCIRKQRNKQYTEETITGGDIKQCSCHNNTDDNELVMADNVLYGGYDDDVNQTEPDKEKPTTEKSTDRPRVVTDVYAQVNKVKKNKKGNQFQLQQDSEDKPTKPKKTLQNDQGSAHSCTTVDIFSTKDDDVK